MRFPVSYTHLDVYKRQSQRCIAEKLNITPQGLTKLLNKKNFGFEDAKKILNVMGYALIIEFEKSEEIKEENRND